MQFRRNLCAPLSLDSSQSLSVSPCLSRFHRRLAKEAAYYEKEAKENEGKLAKMKEEGSDEHDIKKFEEVCGESYMMIPDSKARFQKSLEELALFLDTNELGEGEWVTTAQSILKENGVFLGAAVETETNVDDLKEGEVF